MKSVSQELSSSPSLTIIPVQTRVQEVLSSGPSPTSIHPCLQVSILVRTRVHEVLQVSFVQIRGQGVFAQESS